MIKNTRYTLTGTRLAKLCGVSQGTVDRALHGRGEINEKTKEKILNIAEQYGFLRSDGKTDERTKGIIGVIVFDVVNEYFSNLIMHIKGLPVTQLSTHLVYLSLELLYNIYNMNSK